MTTVPDTGPPVPEAGPTVPDAGGLPVPEAGVGPRSLGRGRPRTAGWTARRRRNGLIAVAVGATVVASIGFDLGRGTTTGDRAGDLRGFASLLNTDVASCNSSLADSWSAYSAVIDGRSAERAAAQSIISGDEPNCTPVANTSLYDMATTEAPSTLRAFDAQSAVVSVDTWAYPQAAAAITDIGRLLGAGGPSGDPGAANDLRIRTAALRALAGSAQRILDTGGRVLRVAVPRLDLGATGMLEAGGF